METSATTNGIEKEKEKKCTILRIETFETITHTDEKHPSALSPQHTISC